MVDLLILGKQKTSWYLSPIIVLQVTKIPVPKVLLTPLDLVLTAITIPAVQIKVQQEIIV